MNARWAKNGTAKIAKNAKRMILERFSRWSHALKLVSRNAQRSAPLRVAAKHILTIEQHG
jgi:hypothetical protein